MKKILIPIAMLMFLSASIPANAACPINQAGGVCKADIGTGINDKLHDKILPNSLNKMIQPNNTMNNRTNLGQPSLPDNINMEPIQEETTQPYDANCQFGNCRNKQNAGSMKNN